MLRLEHNRHKQLKFDADVREDLRLLEVNEETLQEIISQGVIIKGDEHEESVLCTQDRTFALKYVETTNLLLLVAPEQDEVAEARSPSPFGNENVDANVGLGLQTQLGKVQAAGARPPICVRATAKAHIEVVEVAPRLHRLPELISQRPYGLSDEDGDGDEPMGEASSSGSSQDGGAAAVAAARSYTFEELLERVQASPAEVRAALLDMDAIELDGRWRTVDDGYLGQLLEVLLLSAVESGWPLDAIPTTSAVQELASSGYDPRLAQHCLRVFSCGREAAAACDAGAAASVGRPLQTPAPAPLPAVTSLDKRKVCLQVARKLLPQRSWRLEEFVAAWRETVPGCMCPNLDMLKGEVLLEGPAHDQRLKPFPVRALPKDPAQRFSLLFQLRPRWEWKDLQPYLQDMKVPGQSVEALLLKYARASQHLPGDPVMYSSRN